MSGFDQRTFRAVMGSYPTGVTIVTSGMDGQLCGMAANSFTSVSLDPPLVLVCFDRESRTLPVVRESRRFAVNVLRAGDEDLARTFASKRVATAKFEAVTHTVDHGVPVLDCALAWVVCDLQALHPGGDHEIGVGAVTAMGHDPGGEPLVFYGGGYRDLA